MAYTRLIRAYYHHEKPIPLDLKEACRLARAQTPTQRKAVETVLREFFVQLEDGWHQKRCDEEIGRYRDSGTDRQLKAESERERQRRSRERRRQLFEALRGHGVVPKWDTPIVELEAHLSRVTGRDGHAPVTDESREPVTPPVTLATGSHSQAPFPGTSIHNSGGEGEIKNSVPMKNPAREARSRKNGHFETINDTVGKLIASNACQATDIATIAKIAGITEAQARESIRQLNDRGRLS